MEVARNTAKKFGMRPGEEAAFREAWRWRTRVNRKAGLEEAELHREVERQFGIVAAQIRGEARSSEVGHQYVHRARTENRKYVVFSDHHWADARNRQNFFAHSGNRELYIEILGKYFDEDYTVVENGDVEELIIFEPSVNEFRLRSEMNPSELQAHRRRHRRGLMEKILGDPANEALYRTLRRFHDAGRYIKVAGNHDYDLQEGDCYDLLRAAFPGIERPYDLLLLETGNHVEYAVLHGHQFDENTNPVAALTLGETISESMSWAYQGPDRNWTWDAHGRRWADCRAPFFNELVGDFQPKRSQVLAAIGAVLGTLHSRAGWEAIFEHEIAWEYFKSEDPQKAYRDEVQKGQQWFKFRHMNEVHIFDLYRRHFPGGSGPRPKLVLGHSHEVRFEPAYRGPAGEVDFPPRRFSQYFNTGAAGRFENLIWALEIDDGHARLVSWHRPRPGDRAPVRQVFNQEMLFPMRSVLRAAPRATGDLE
ncbi:MAG: hypothetical protein IT285_07765 [Bdellovibrionales bacterium]|nr:hypothetical protein [Bdellovibrionales bacterium]